MSADKSEHAMLARRRHVEAIGLTIVRRVVLGLAVGSIPVGIGLGLWYTTYDVPIAVSSLIGAAIYLLTVKHRAMDVKQIIHDLRYWMATALLEITLVATLDRMFRWRRLSRTVLLLTFLCIAVPGFILSLSKHRTVPETYAAFLSLSQTIANDLPEDWISPATLQTLDKLDPKYTKRLYPALPPMLATLRQLKADLSPQETPLTQTRLDDAFEQASRALERTELDTSHADGFLVAIFQAKLLALQTQQGINTKFVAKTIEFKDRLDKATTPIARNDRETQALKFLNEARVRLDAIVLVFRAEQCDRSTADGVNNARDLLSMARDKLLAARDTSSSPAARERAMNNLSDVMLRLLWLGNGPLPLDLPANWREVCSKLIADISQLMRADPNVYYLMTLAQLHCTFAFAIDKSIPTGATVDAEALQEMTTHLDNAITLVQMAMLTGLNPAELRSRSPGLGLTLLYDGAASVVSEHPMTQALLVEKSAYLNRVAPRPAGRWHMPGWR